ncbi:hypothetical protein [Streptomyces goshikiensis]|uniref:hypothetical protein n=1 Tax=Streptomyces goshikiensis TaxID=1942 RepID=UPI003322C136
MLRALDADRSRPFEPVPACLVREPVPVGQVVPVDIALGASSTLFRAGEQLRQVLPAAMLTAGIGFALSWLESSFISII